VARYGKAQKEATRQRILDTAGRRFKRDGIDGSGVATLMADAGLTNGAFYAHFSSKDDLVATTIGDQLRAQCDQFSQWAEQPAGMEAAIRSYLSEEHRDHPEDGCPSAALLDEIGRGSPEVKRAYTAGLLPVVEAMAAQLHPGDPQAAHGPVLSIFAQLLGTLQLSRAVDDPELSRRLLQHGIDTALSLWAEHADCA
jgi:TetR/AcrR family transcriptional regulator, transcriptional repressor for nem operon